MKKVLVLYGYADYNKGDGAICLGMEAFFKQLKGTYSLDFALFHEDEYHIYNKKTVDFLNKYNLNHVYLPRTKKNKYLNLIDSVLNIKDKSIEKFMKNSDYGHIVFGGGHFIYDASTSLKQRLINILRLHYLLNPILVSGEKINKMILAQSFGPFNNKITNAFIKKYLKGTDLFISRESTSAIKLKELMVNCHSGIDFAFFIDHKSNIQTKRISNLKETIPNKYIVINLRKAAASGGLSVSDDNSKKLEEQIINFIKFVLKNDLNMHIIFFSQVTSFDSENVENDNIIHQQIKQKHFNEESRISVLDQELEIDEIISFYEDASCVISTRFHAVIFAIIAKTTFIALNHTEIGYKMSGMLEDIGALQNLYNYDANEERLLSIYKNMVKDDFKFNETITKEIEKKKNEMIGKVEETLV